MPTGNTPWLVQCGALVQVQQTLVEALQIVDFAVR